MLRSWLSVSAAAVVLSGCPSPPGGLGPDAAPFDAPRRDAPLFDSAMAIEAGASDAGSSDTASAPDAAATDDGGAATDAPAELDAAIELDASLPIDAGVPSDASVVNADAPTSMPSCRGSEIMCACATGWYCLRIGGFCLSPSAPCP